MEHITINLFYPLLFTTIGLFIIISGIVIVKCKDSSLFNNIFNRHVDEHIDTTDKFLKSQNKVVDGLPVVYHKEIHNLELSVKDNKQKIIKLAKELNQKIDIIIEKITVLETK